MKKKTSVVLAENQFIVREGIKALLSKMDDITIIGDVDNGADAIKMIIEKSPDLVIVDIMMPKKNGIEVIRHVKSTTPDVKCMVLSAYQEDEYIFASMKAGANGYLLKDSSFEELKIAIRSIIQGKSYIGSDIANVFLNGMLHRNSSFQQDNPYTSKWDSLTQREKEIANMIATGKNNKEIASDLCISIKTVGTHRSNIMRKLKLNNSAALTAFVIERKNTIQLLS